MSSWCIHTYPLLSLRTHWYTHTWELRRWNLLCKKKKKYNHSDWWWYQTYKRLDFSFACRYNGPPSTWRILLKCFAKNLRCLSVFYLFGKASGRPTVAKASTLFFKKRVPTTSISKVPTFSPFTTSLWLQTAAGQYLYRNGRQKESLEVWNILISEAGWRTISSRCFICSLPDAVIGNIPPRLDRDLHGWGGRMV